MTELISNSSDNAKQLPASETEKLTEIIKETCLRNVKISIAPGSQKGDNFIGRIFRVIVNGIDVDGKNKLLNLIVKCSVRGDEFREVMPVDKLYQRECFTYGTILPTFEDLEQSLRIDKVFKNYPKIFKLCDRCNDEFLIMQDVRANGFQMVDRQTTLDYNHCVLFMETIARFHALSYALKHHKPDRFREIVSNCPEFFFRSTENGPMQEFVSDMITKAISSLDERTDDELVTKVRTLSTELWRKMMDLSDVETNDEYAVIIHGDCWVNNLLFKYDDEDVEKKRPTGLCLIDFQEARYVSPIWDLANFMYSSISYEFCCEYFEKLLQVYRNSLTDRLLLLDCDINLCFPDHAFCAHINKYFQVGVVLAFIQIPLLISDTDEIPDVECKSTENSDELAIANFHSKNTSLYNQRMRGVIRHASQSGFI